MRFAMDMLGLDTVYLVEKQYADETLAIDKFSRMQRGNNNGIKETTDTTDDNLSGKTYIFNSPKGIKTLIKRGRIKEGDHILMHGHASRDSAEAMVSHSLRIGGELYPLDPEFDYGDEEINKRRDELADLWKALKEAKIATIAISSCRLSEKQAVKLAKETGVQKLWYTTEDHVRKDLGVHAEWDDPNSPSMLPDRYIYDPGKDGDMKVVTPSTKPEATEE